MAEPKTPELETPEEEVTPEVEPEEVETPEEEAQEEEAPEEELAEEEPEEPKPSRRETLRIAQILAKRETESPRPDITGGMDYGKELNADPETIAKLDADRKAVADAALERGLKQADAIKWETRLEVDAPRVESRYPLLDKSSDEFHPVVADALNKSYLSAVGFDPSTNTVQNPNLRYLDYIEGMMELVEEVAGRQVSKTTDNIKKQAARTGLRPDGSSAKRMNLNKAPEDMSDEELKAKMQQLGL